MNILQDTNALIKLYHEEKGSSNLKSFLAKSERDLTLNISQLSILEFHTAFMRRVFTKDMDLENAKELLNLFQKDLPSFGIIPMDSNLIFESLKLINTIAGRFNLRTLDSIQLTCCIMTNDIIPIDYFIPSDIKLLNVVKNYFQIYNPEE